MTTIVSWNLGERSSGKPEAWNFLRDELGADLALVQEAVVPTGARAVFRPGGIASRDGKERSWGSAVVALTDRVKITPLEQVEGTWHGRRQGVARLECVSRGHVAVAVVDLPDLRLTVVSAYGLIEFGYAAGTMLRTIADLEPLFDDPDHGQNVLLAGDWNIGTWWTGNDAKYARREGAVLGLLTAYGLVDCLDRHIPADRGRLPDCSCSLAEACRHVWTYRKESSATAYQDDYLYATPALEKSLTFAGVAPAWDWDRRLSDHAPLIANLGQ